MRRFWCSACRATVRFSPTSEYEEVEGKRFRVYICTYCKYRLHVVVDA